MKKFTAVTLVIVLVIAGLLLYKLWPTIKDIKAARLEARQCRQLETGMTLEQVIAIMGSADEHHFNSEQKVDFYTFSSRIALAEPMGVGIKDGVVIGISCGD